jgi:hypothetical protein
MLRSNLVALLVALSVVFLTAACGCECDLYLNPQELVSENGPATRAQADAHPSQELRESQWITVSGTAVLPDGAVPAANLAVAVREPTREVIASQQHDGPILARATTDGAGRFSIKFDHRDQPVVFLEIGEKLKSAWILKPVENRGKDLDLGRVLLREKVAEERTPRVQERSPPPARARDRSRGFQPPVSDEHRRTARMGGRIPSRIVVRPPGAAD